MELGRYVIKTESMEIGIKHLAKTIDYFTRLRGGASASHGKTRNREGSGISMKPSLEFCRILSFRDGRDASRYNIDK